MSKLIKMVIILIIIIIGVYVIKNNTYAKYNIDKELLAATINIDKNPPKIEYDFKKDGNKIELIIYANEEIKQVDGWELEENKKNLKKTFVDKVDEIVLVEDIYGNQSGYHFYATLDMIEN